RAPIYYSDDLGLTWQALADNLPAEAEVSFMGWMGGRMLVATDNLGLFISDERLANWQAISTDLASPKLNALWVEGKDIYVGVYREGIFTSSDLGQSWQSLQHNLPDKRVQALRILDGKLVVGTDSGIYQFDKKLSKWESLYEGPQILSLERLDDLWIAGTSQGTIASRDQGQSWQWISQQGAVHYTRVIEDQIVELAIDGGLRFSEDQGETWQAIEYGQEDASYVFEMAKVGDMWILSNDYGIHRSLRGYQDWRLGYGTETMAFFDFLQKGERLYGGTRAWDQFRGR
ncbi:MAG: hypothetical protein AAGM67_11820, partial [Bacteroidota bacterium]